MKRTLALFLQLLAAASFGGLAHSGPSKEKITPPSTGHPKEGSYHSIVLGGGCFWCLEAVYERIDGIQSVVSGYAGGDEPNPNYETVSSGTTGHAEVVKITFDPGAISLEKILDLFWKSHDPTTKDRQGADVGPQYRSIILYRGEPQRLAAEESRKRLNASGLYSRPAVTEIAPLASFYEAEAYHQDYYEKNPLAGYCRVVIRPKLEKLGLDVRALPVPKP